MIDALGASRLLEIWDAGFALSVPERGIALLTAFDFQEQGDDSDLLPTGWRNRSLLALHVSLYGRELAGLVVCAACGGSVKITLGTASLDRHMRSSDDLDAVAQAAWFDVATETLRCRCRVPNSADQVALPARSGLSAARDFLIKRCVTSVERDGVAIEPTDLTEIDIALIGEAIERRDPGVALEISYECPVCGTADACFLDLPSFLWGRLRSEARRLMYEIDVLARGYGWRECDILALSPPRRHRYVEMLSS